MNRRRFAQAIAGAVLGLRGYREPVFAEPAPAAHVSWPPAPVSDEMVADSAADAAALARAHHEATGGYLVQQEFAGTVQIFGGDRLTEEMLTGMSTRGLHSFLAREVRG